MAFATIDPRRALARPWVYRRSQGLLRGDRFYRIIVDDYLRPRAGDRILDVGCGPAEVLAHLPEVDYLGLDLSADYIAAAEARFGGRGRFACAPLDEARIDEIGPGSFDLVLASGLLHHLDDREARAFLELAHGALRPGGRLITLDGCFVPDQSALVRSLLRWDRGRFVRDRGGYLALAGAVFGAVRDSLRDDLLRIPYSLLFLECERGGAPSPGEES